MKLSNVETTRYEFQDARVGMPEGNYYGVILQNSEPYTPQGENREIIMGRVATVRDTGTPVEFNDDTEVTVYNVASGILHGGLGIPTAVQQQEAFDNRTVFHFNMRHIPQQASFSNPQGRPRKVITLL